MECEFSEVKFVFGILHELANKYHEKERGWKAPDLPTQRAEKKLGYDVKIEGAVRSIFFQFKVPEKKTTANAKYWGLMGGPYYEFHIRPNNISPQHNKLIDLAKSCPCNKVYYCAPRFHTNEEYEEYYKNERIARNSVYVPCITLKEITGSDAHRICYTKNPRVKSQMCSEPHSIKGFSLDEFEEDIINSATYEDVRECLFDVAKKFSIKVKNRDNIDEMYDEIANYLLLNEDLIFVLIGE